MENFLDSIFSKLLKPIEVIFGAIFGFIFSSKITTLIFGFLFMNLIGYTLMRLDKKYAKEDKRRISERTLFLTALLFGSVGILLGMKKFRHKTLHKSFTIGIPLIIAAQIILVIYTLIKGMLV